ncbi:polyhydroxyalkanoate synthase [Insolitispirillum peregrinum]|uniref:Polyhydroxyalkanoate synthase n=2 Tax=Insolitispirillum peregrinum TaxID=80876 RepID=A0A1N7IJN2_9PROT|nr:polyhydroxyalkanoate synthase [Insolitispirillum peregrinum]
MALPLSREEERVSMADQQNSKQATPNADHHPDMKIPDPAEVSKAMANIAERSQRLVSDFLARQAEHPEPAPTDLDPMHVGKAFMEMTARLMANPARLVEAQVSLWQDYMNLWQNTARRMFGEETSPVIVPDKTDRRFKDDAWHENEVFDFIKQSYLLTSRWLTNVANDVEGLDTKDAKKVEFYTRQFIDAMAPSNFLFTNPEVLRVTVESGGENLLKGLEHLLSDLERGHGRLRISMTNESAFEVGRNIASTPGSVVYQNDMMQLIQYTPTTEKVKSVPVMIVPPWINKFYILDLREKNSLIKWLVDQGYTTFVISWVNPDETLKDKSFDDYMLEGTLAGINAIQDATGASKVNAIGYCLGGTLLASTAAYLKATGQDRLNSATFLTTLTDFSEPGELGVFIDEEQLDALDERMQKAGYLDGGDMATTFNMLRANDLIWSFVVNNYLLGKEPFPFDLLYWNGDSTRMPAAMHSFYLHKMYQENKLIQPGGVVLQGVPLDLGKVDIPVYMLSCREDHIAPWTSTFAATNIYSGKVKFVLSASGHIAGVVNPPVANKYCYWTNNRKVKSPDAWLKGAQQHEGSWWTDWNEWCAPLSGPDVPALQPGSGKLPVLEAAPGSYVKIRAV